MELTDDWLRSEKFVFLLSPVCHTKHLSVFSDENCLIFPIFTWSTTRVDWLVWYNYVSSVAHPISCILCRDIGLSRGKRFFFCGSALPPPSPFRIVFSSCVPLRLRRLPTTPYLVSHEVNVVSLLYLWEAFATATCKILILPLLQLDCHDFECSLRWNKKMNYKLIYETDLVWKIYHSLSTRFSHTFAYPLYRYFIVLWFGFLSVLKA